MLFDWVSILNRNRCPGGRGEDGSQEYGIVNNPLR